MIGGRNENAYSCQFLYLWWSGLDFLGTPYPRTFLLAGGFNTAPATSIGQRQMVDHSHGSDSRPACFRLFKLGHYRLYRTIDMSDEMHSYIRLPATDPRRLARPATPTGSSRTAIPPPVARMSHASPNTARPFSPDEQRGVGAG